MRIQSALDDVFATGSHVRVLRALYNLPGGAAVSGREIARRARISNPTAQSVLRSLADQGLLIIRRSPRSASYRLNSDHVLFAVIAGLFTTEDAIPRRLRDDLGSALPRLGDVESAYIFGSAARGEMRPDSDIDVAVTLKGTAQLPVEQEVIEALERRYGSHINVMPLRPRRSRTLRARILREGIPLVIPKRRSRAI